MAVRAFGDPVLGGELAAMRIGVARFAILRRSFELNVMRALKRLVAIAAGDRAMSAQQRKFRLGMIEAPDVDPRTRGVARLATQGSSIVRA